MELLIPVAFGVESTVKRQLFHLGYPDAKAIDGKIAVDGEWQDVARLNVFLRSGERVQIQLARFKATTFDEAYDAIYGVEWENWITNGGRVLVDVKCVNSVLMAEKALGGVMKKAIMSRLEKKYRCSQSDDGARHIVSLSLRNDEAVLCLDTSGDGLHKRGYRTLAYEAPLKETLAAAMIDGTFYRADKPFADLFCGSGTLPIEACLIANNVAPSKNRSFDFAQWHCVPSSVLQRAKEEALDGEKHQKLRVYAYDINKEAISIARFHARNAGVEDYIHFQAADMRTFSCSHPYGVICSNPPYGERMGTQKEVAQLYADFAKVYRALPDWSAYMLTSFDGFERAFGKKADKRRKLYNANLQCTLYSYFGKKPEENKHDFTH